MHAEIYKIWWGSNAPYETKNVVKIWFLYFCDKDNVDSLSLYEKQLKFGEFLKKKKKKQSNIYLIIWLIIWYLYVQYRKIQVNEISSGISPPEAGKPLLAFALEISESSYFPINFVHAPSITFSLHSLVIPQYVSKFIISDEVSRLWFYFNQVIITKNPLWGEGKSWNPLLFLLLSWKKLEYSQIGFFFLTPPLYSI